jgi:hypothetical protein
MAADEASRVIENALSWQRYKAIQSTKIAVSFSGGEVHATESSADGRYGVALEVSLIPEAFSGRRFRSESPQSQILNFTGLSESRTSNYRLHETQS